MSQQTCVITGINLEETGFGYTLSVIGGKYKMIVLFWLFHYPPVMRFNELKRCIGTISFKTLSATLKELEADGLIIRNRISADSAESRIRVIIPRAFFDANFK